MADDNPGNPPHEDRSLRERAEKLLHSTRAELARMDPEDVQHLVYELQVHAIELQLQNEELQRAQLELGEIRDRYSDLYEFAPVGYLSLDLDGVIRQANLTSADLFRRERHYLIGTKLSALVAPESQDALFLNWQDVLEPQARTTCELTMKQRDGQQFEAQLNLVALSVDEGNSDPLQISEVRVTLQDVTMRKRAEQERDASERRFRWLTEALTDYVYQVRIEEGHAVETIHRHNCLSITGYGPEELDRDPNLWQRLIPEEDTDRVERHLQQVQIGEAPTPLEHRIRHRDGSLRWVLSTISPDFDAEGRLVGYDGLLRDITRQKVSEAALQKLRQNLEQRVLEQTREIQLLAEAISHLGEGVVITDDELDWPGPRIRFVNEATCRITGYSVDELIGQTPRIFQGEDSSRDTLDRIREALAAKQSCLAEVKNYRKDGTAYHAELFIPPLYDAEGRRTNFVSIHRDITERKNAEQRLRNSEERLRAILNTAADAIITIDQQGILDDVNLATMQTFGYTREELIGQNVKMLMPSPYREEHDEYLARYLRTGESRIIGCGRELVAQRKDGSTFPIDLAVSEVEQLHLFTGIVRDVSLRKELESQLVRISDAEQQSIGQELHDDVGQELTGIALLIQALQRLLQRNSSTREMDLLNRLTESVQRAQTKVGILARGLIPVAVASEGLMSALSKLSERINENGDVRCQFLCQVPVHLESSEVATQLYRITQEAVRNAIRHGQANRICIMLEKTDEQVTLKIEDDGIGINPVQAVQAPGMGMRIMEHRASLARGTLTVSRGRQGGTLVTCALQMGSNHGRQ